MFAKIFALTLVIGAYSRVLPNDNDFIRPFGDLSNIINDDLEDYNFEKTAESVRPIYLSRVARQVRGSVNTNPDGSANVMGKIPLAGNDKNILSGVGGIYGAKDGGFSAASAGLALDNINGHGASITGKHIPDFGNQLTGAGKVNLFHNDKHDLNANAFATRSFPKNPVIPNFNTYGAGVDYTFNNKVGASLGVAHTDLLKRTDYSAMGNLNLFRNPSSSLDFNAGATRSMSPYIPKSNWEPTFGMTYSRYF
ncbi:attacin-like [Zerene cesonia]|uniref:attacin-like n=1 Tax=Zerene cesonia TaxID=33412 RepID=UPI0018E536CE|nr:attacin-like [Zerene cesonia]